MHQTHYNLRIILRKFISRLPISDKLFRSLLFWVRNKRHLNLKDPETFTDKLNWLMTYTDFRQYAQYVDKYEVRDYVGQMVGDQFLNELYGLYSDENEIDFTILPSKFILKATHGSGMVFICHNKSEIYIPKVQSLCRKWLSTNYYYNERELNYYDIKPRIICEKLLLNPNGELPIDYKFYCFNGKAKIIYVDFDRYGNHTRNLYNMNWELLPYKRDYPNHPVPFERPVKFDEMVNIAEILSSPFSIVRVDFFEVDRKIIFGELTFTPAAGLPKMSLDLDLQMGKWLNITNYTSLKEK